MTYLVVGSGSIGTRHHGNLQALGADSRLISWRTLDLEALDLSGVTGLVIATATQVRRDLFAKAAAANVPVYVEKPLAYRQFELSEIQSLAAPIAERSVLGVMMRYHPAIRYLAAHPVNAYGFHFEIGHDVRQWRQNWSFADSYAAKPEGGGVLLDLCHEIDMAHCLFPTAAANAVDCVGHVDFPGVDFATRLSLSGDGRIGSVAMDYLSPESTRTMVLRGRDEVVEIDLLTCTGRRWSGGATEDLVWDFERNDMFLDLMRDFIALAEGGTPSDNPLLPRLDKVWDSAEMIAKAWEQRTFHTEIEGGFA